MGWDWRLSCWGYGGDPECGSGQEAALCPGSDHADASCSVTLGQALPLPQFPHLLLQGAVPTHCLLPATAPGSGGATVDEDWGQGALGQPSVFSTDPLSCPGVLRPPGTVGLGEGRHCREETQPSGGSSHLRPVSFRVLGGMSPHGSVHVPTLLPPAQPRGCQYPQRGPRRLGTLPASPAWPCSARDAPAPDRSQRRGHCQRAGWHLEETPGPLPWAMPCPAPGLAALVSLAVWG